MPEPVRSTIDVEVRYIETDQMGHVHHANYVAWFELARTRLCATSGIPYADVESMGYLMVVTGSRGEFRHLQLRVFERAVQFHKVVVHFGDGASQELALRDVIRAGGRSRVLDLEGRARVIRSIDFWYDAQSIGHGKGALVKVFGQH